MSSRLYLRIFTNRTCTLCDNAKEALVRINKKVPFDIEEVDIHVKGNEMWFNKYCFDVPVIHVSKGLGDENERKEEILAMHRIDEPLVTQRLLSLLNNDKK